MLGAINVFADVVFAVQICAAINVEILDCMHNKCVEHYGADNCELIGAGEWY